MKIVGKLISIQLIQKYYTKLDKVIRYGGSRNESSLRKPFQDLLEQYADSVLRRLPSMDGMGQAFDGITFGV